jgi:rhamnulokinase
MDEEVYKVISEEDLYAGTGIEKMLHNTIYQLMAVKTKHPEYIEEAEHILMTPDYFNFLLTGVKKNEYTIASTSQLVNAKEKDWDFELIEMLGLNPKMFKSVSPPKTKVGELMECIQEEVGFNCTVILAGSHDTASAVLAVPTNDDDAIYISSGTWSLMGIERRSPDCREESRLAGFTNEGGVDYRFRYLKNIMGLWMIQSVKKEFSEDLSFSEICRRASKEKISSIIDCNHKSFMAPENMIKAVQEYCKKTNQQVPESVGEIAAVIYNSLAKYYQDTVIQIEKITGRTYDNIYVVGGGSNAEYLNELTAKYTGKKVSAGPGEATAIGNVLTQMLYDGTFKSIQEARECVVESFEIVYYN